jgi:hypothetical protein
MSYSLRNPIYEIFLGPVMPLVCDRANIISPAQDCQWQNYGDYVKLESSSCQLNSSFAFEFPKTLGPIA